MIEKRKGVMRERDMGKNMEESAKEEEKKRVKETEIYHYTYIENSILRVITKC